MTVEQRTYALYLRSERKVQGAYLTWMPVARGAPLLPVMAFALRAGAVAGAGATGFPVTCNTMQHHAINSAMPRLGPRRHRLLATTRP